MTGRIVIRLDPLSDEVEPEIRENSERGESGVVISLPQDLSQEECTRVLTRIIWLLAERPRWGRHP